MSVRSSSSDDTGNIIALIIDKCSNAGISTGTGVSNSLHGHVPPPEKQWQQGGARAAAACGPAAVAWACSCQTAVVPCRREGAAFNVDRSWLFTHLWQTLDAAVLHPIAAAADNSHMPSRQGLEQELEADVQVRWSLDSVQLHVLRHSLVRPALSC